MADFSKYVGIPFAEHGRDESGCDCWGLVRLVYQEQYGVDLPDLGPLYRDTKDFDGMAGVYQNLKPTWDRVGIAGEGDVVLLKVVGHPVHVGIMIDPWRMLHIERGLDAVIERLASPVWKNRIEGYYRCRNVNLKSLGSLGPMHVSKSEDHQG